MRVASSNASLGPRPVEMEFAVYALRNRGHVRHGANDDELLVQYLLGELGEEEQEGVELRFISDPQFYEQLLCVEDDLIDAYAQDELSHTRRARFENHFVKTPGRRARVGFARVWPDYVARQSEVARPAPEPVRHRGVFAFLRLEGWPASLAAAAAVLAVLAAGWLGVESLRLRNQIEQAKTLREALERSQGELREQIDAERRRSEELSSQLERARQARDEQAASQAGADSTLASVIALVLTQNVRGPSGADRLIIPPGARWVRLSVSFRQGSYQSYTATIRTVEGRTIFSKPGLKARSAGAGGVVTVLAPAAVFATEDYILTLDGVNDSGPPEEVSKNSFSTSRK